MSLSYQDQFKLAFLRQCAAEGITDEAELLDRIRMAKQALGGPVGDVVGKLVSDYGVPLVVGTALGAPLVVGGAAGAAHGLTSFSNDMDVEDAQQQELKEHYESLAQQLLASNRLKKQRLQTGRIPRHLRI